MLTVGQPVATPKWLSHWRSTCPHTPCARPWWLHVQFLFGVLTCMVLCGLLLQGFCAFSGFTRGPLFYVFKYLSPASTPALAVELLQVLSFFPCTSLPNPLPAFTYLTFIHPLATKSHHVYWFKQVDSK